ncbi:peptidase S8/S53 domain-containing protein [Fimicolochytrium jonesii]|uniref:peptidase S8/S53 domain-containing protein n=1 Tax=Fimicolochytrium jonesii TaxID=1396493 RepID=UPI0022FE284E|nr:peptidase S8/S53 domain-containing protein [Fimicolochytrium jonesii]KAI8816628.1 peptidase S8/S53 domain-containing protein [Fimicolochytrium jonesii]
MHVEVDYHGAVNAVATQENPPWGLDRIDQKTLPLNNEYTYLDTAGDGVDIYVVDTGININHTEFEGRAVWGVTVRTDGAPDYDDNGHGSHVAGIAGGKTYGAAKAVKLIAVKALDGNGAGPFSELIDGLQWVARTAPGTGRPSVVNLSIQGAVSQALNQACTGLITLGIHVISATGNSGEDACGYSPAVIAPQTAIISVGAVDDTDAVPPFSNYGACVSLLGPGVNILSVDGCKG